MRVECKHHLDYTVGTLARDMKITSIVAEKNDEGLDKVIITGQTRDTHRIVQITYPRAIVTLRFEGVYADLSAEYFHIKMLDEDKKLTLREQFKDVFKSAKDCVLSWFGKE